jgi:MFS family permease
MPAQPVATILLCAAALPLMFRSESFATVVVVAPLLGLGIAAVTPVTNALIADLASARRLGAAMGAFGDLGHRRGGRADRRGLPDRPARLCLDL